MLITPLPPGIDVIKGQRNCKEAAGRILVGGERQRVLDEHALWLARAPELLELETQTSPLGQYLQRCGWRAGIKKRCGKRRLKQPRRTGTTE